jgi:hypothetical protein
MSVQQGKFEVDFIQYLKAFLKVRILMPLSMPLFEAIEVASVFSQ